MPKRIDKTTIKARALKINDAWKEGAPTVEFMGVAQAELNDAITAVEAKEKRLDDMRAQVKMPKFAFCTAKTDSLLTERFSRLTVRHRIMRHAKSARG